MSRLADYFAVVGYDYKKEGKIFMNELYVSKLILLLSYIIAQRNISLYGNVIIVLNTYIAFDMSSVL